MNDHGNTTAATTGNTDTGDTLEYMDIQTPPHSPTATTTSAPGSGVKRTISERNQDELEGVQGITIKKEIMDDKALSSPTGRQKTVHTTNITTHSIGNNNIIHGSIVNASNTQPISIDDDNSPTSYTTEDLYGKDTSEMEIDNNAAGTSSIVRAAEAQKQHKDKSIVTFDIPSVNNTSASTIFQKVLEEQRQRLETYNPDEKGVTTETTEASYATAVHSPQQTKMTEPVIIHKTHSFRLMWSFHARHPKTQYIMARKKKGEILQTAIKQLLRAGMETTEDFAINAWDERSKLNTLQKPEDVPSDYDTLIKYIRQPDKGGIRQGDTNHNWGVNITCGVCMKHFIGYWNEMRPYKKKERLTSIFQPIREAPLQATEWHDAGWFVGATAKQYTEENLAHIQQHLPDVTIGLNWQGIQFNRAHEHWRHAEKTFKNNKDMAEKAKLSPTSFQVLVHKESDVGPVMKYLYQHYGKLGEKGTWPSMPDGSKMRYTPNFRYLKDQKGRNAINKRMALHIQMKWSNQTIESSIKNPGMKLDCLEGKSIGQAILEYEQEIDGQSEPYFRHFSKVWNRDPTIEKWEICVHQHMYRAANEQYHKIIQDLATKHGDAIYDAFDTDNTSYAAHTKTPVEETITFELDDDDDMYMTGKGNFKFQGIQIVDKDKEAASKLQQMNDDAATSVGFSEHENQTGTPPEDDHPTSGWQTVTRNNRKAKHKADNESPHGSPSSTNAAKGR